MSSCGTFLRSDLCCSTYDSSFAVGPYLSELLKNTVVLGFDFDGVIAMTEYDQFRGFTGQVFEHTGIEVSLEAATKELLGRPERFIVRTFQERYGIDGDLEELLDERGDLYVESVISSNLRPNPFVYTLCREIVENGGHKPIIITNGRHKIQSRLLENWSIGHFFSEVFCSDTMRPDVPEDTRKITFLRELPRRYGIEPHQFVMIEDSAKTLKKLDACGIRGIYVKHDYNDPYTPNTGVVLNGYLKQSALRR
jgi:FMN phosphatase YigB (HAD superfamily)